MVRCTCWGRTSPTRCTTLTGSYTIAVIGAALGVGLFALIFERLFMSRVYSADVLLQLLVCYAFILILDDAVQDHLGRGVPVDGHAAGVPASAHPARGRRIAGVLPVPHRRDDAGGAHARLRHHQDPHRENRPRAAAINPTMTSALGINTALVFGGVFALVGLLAGLAGALAVPVRSMVAGMGFSILIESFIVTVIGGMGSVAGALVGALLIGLVRSFGTIGFPLSTEGLMFVFMVAVLIAKPKRVVRQGSLGMIKSPIVRDALHRRRGARWCCACCRALFPSKALSRFRDPPVGVRGIRDFAEPADRLRRHGVVRPRPVLRPGRLQFRVADAEDGHVHPGGVRLTILINGVVAAVVGASASGSKEIYFSFLTLAFQMLLHSCIIAWTSVTGGDQGLTGGVPRPPFLGIRPRRPGISSICSAAS